MEAETIVKIDESDTPGRYYQVNISWDLSVGDMDAKTAKEARANLDKIKEEVAANVRATMESVSSSIQSRFTDHFDNVYVNNTQD